MDNDIAAPAWLDSNLQAAFEVAKWVMLNFDHGNPLYISASRWMSRILANC
jgi:hypothetical protein